MSIDDEAERLARGFGWRGSSEVTPVARDVRPTVAERYGPTRPAPSDAAVARRVEQDIAALDAEIDPESAPKWTRHTYGTGPRASLAEDMERQLFLSTLRDWWVQSNTYQTLLGLNAVHIVHDEYGLIDSKAWALRSAYGPGRQKKPKTYNPSGRKHRAQTWMDRQQQSKEAKQR